jgi:hypothetical protein
MHFSFFISIRDIEEQKEIPLEEASPQGHEVENDLKSATATKVSIIFTFY